MDPLSWGGGRTTAPVTISNRLASAVPTAVYSTQGVYSVGESLSLSVVIMMTFSDGV